MSTQSKPKPEIPPPIKINPSEQEMAFWAAIMELDTPNGASSINSSAAPSTPKSSSVDSIPHDLDYEHLEQKEKVPISQPISIYQSQTHEAKPTGAMLIPGLFKMKTKMDNYSKEHPKPINDPRMNDEDDDGYVDGGLHGHTNDDIDGKDNEETNLKKPKKKLPSPTIETNTMIEIGMWQLLKQRKKYDKKYASSTDDESDEKENEQKKDDQEQTTYTPRKGILYCM